MLNKHKMDASGTIGVDLTQQNADDREVSRKAKLPLPESNSMDDRVRIKIPIGPKLLQRIGQCAEVADRSQSWIAAQLLAGIADDRRHFAGWLYWRVSGGVVASMKAAGDAVKAFAGLKAEPIEEASEYLQVYVSPELAEEIATVGRSMNLSQADAAAQMLYCGIEVEAWMIHAVNSPAFRLAQKFTGIRGRNVKGNREPDEHVASATKDVRGRVRRLKGA